MEPVEFDPDKFSTYLNWKIQHIKIIDGEEEPTDGIFRPCRREDFLRVGAENIWDARFPDEDYNNLLVCDNTHEIAYLKDT